MGQHDNDIKQILKQSGLLNDQEANQVIAKLPAAPAGGAAAFSLGPGICKLLCQLAQAACKLACSKISDPTGQQLCMSACDTGEGICEQKCH